MQYSILIVDDHPIVLQGTKSILESANSYQAIDAVHDVADAVDKIKRKDYHMLITDYEMPGMTGMELIQLAKAVSPDIKTLVISMHDDPGVIKRLLAMNVDGFILKNDIHADIRLAVHRIFSGGVYLSDAVSAMLIHHEQKETISTVLTPREREIVRLIVKEYSTRQIAELLQLSEKTVETHRKNILKKTGSSNLVALIKYAFTNDLI